MISASQLKSPIVWIKKEWQNGSISLLFPSIFKQKWTKSNRTRCSQGVKVRDHSSFIFRQLFILRHTPRKKWLLYFWKQMVYIGGLRLVEREWTWTVGGSCGADVPNQSFTRFTPRSILMRMNFTRVTQSHRDRALIAQLSATWRSSFCLCRFFLWWR